MANILFLGGGRRVELSRLFWAEGLTVFAYELSADVPLDREAEVLVGRRWDSPDLGADLAAVCRVNDIDLVLPLDDQAAAIAPTLDLPCRLVGSAAAQTCYDKQAFAEFCLATRPNLYPKPVDGYRGIYKPRFGHGSNGLVKGPAYHGWTPDGMVTQRFVDGDEYTVDCYFNLYGKLVGACPRLRERVAGGEVLDSVTVDRPDLAAASKSLGEAMGLRGPACFQFIVDGADRPWVIECNARFGGGSTLAVQSGLLLHKYVLQEYSGEFCRVIPEASAEVKAGVRMRRSYRDHFWF